MRKTIYAILAGILTAFLIWAVVPIEKEEADEESDPVVCYEEDPYEDAKIKAALVRLSKDEETARQAFGFDVHRMIRVLTQEACDYEDFDVVWAVCTAMENATDIHHTVDDRIDDGWYASPAKFQGEKAWRAFYKVFVYDSPYEEIEDAKYFYSTRGGFVSKTHEENMEFVKQVGDVRFFRDKEANDG